MPSHGTYRINSNQASQHGVRNDRSCLAYLVSFCDKVTHRLHEGKAVDVAYLDFSKVFDSFPQCFPGETGCSWLGQADSLLGEELPDWLVSKSCSEWSSAHLMADHK